MLPDPQVVGLSGLPPQQVSHPLVVDLQVTDDTKRKKRSVASVVIVKMADGKEARANNVASPDFRTERRLVPASGFGDPAEQTFAEPRDQTCVTLKPQHGEKLQSELRPEPSADRKASAFN